MASNPLLTTAVKSALYRSGALAFVRYAGRSSARMPILQYHSVSVDGGYRTPSIAVSPALFDRQMAFLAARYRVISLDEVVGAIEARRPFPRHAVAITFDDGYLDNYTAALPILVRHRLTATFFITAGPVARDDRFWVSWLRRVVLGAGDLRGLARNGLVRASLTDRTECTGRERIIDDLTGRVNSVGLAEREDLLRQVAGAVGIDAIPDIGRDALMRPEHVRALAQAGMTIGSHTVSHPNLPSLTADEAFNELVESKRLLEALTGKAVTHVAYPGGPEAGRPTYTQDTMTLARRAGYRSACTSLREAAALQSNPFALGRYDIHERMGIAGFAFRLEQPRLGWLAHRRGHAMHAPTSERLAVR